MMRLTLSAAVLLTAALGLAPASRIGPLPPRSRLAREVVVYGAEGREAARFNEPGQHTAELAGRELRVRISRRSGPEGPPAYRDCSPGEVMRLAEELGAADDAEPLRVRFEDVLTETKLFGPTPLEVPLRGAPAGVAVGCLFRTEAGLECLVPAGRGDLLALAEVAAAGDRLRVSGVLAAAGPGGVRVLVEQAGFAGAEQAADEPPWQVELILDGEALAQLTRTGDYPLRLQPAGEGEPLEVLVSLRQFKEVKLEVGGHAVRAELADTWPARQWGLQGHTGLRADEGMLFFFERPAPVRFVMKTVSFPLSVAFINDRGVIVHIGRMVPGDQAGVRAPVPVRYVLEMERGWFRRRGLGVGDEVRIP
jgi:hypothetical protein